MGRPTKYKTEYRVKAIDFLAEGKSVTQLSAHMGVHKSTIYQWAKDYPEFSDALTRGRELSQAYWETELVEMMRDRNVNAPLVKLYFANRFGWHDKSAHDHTTSGEKLTGSPIIIGNSAGIDPEEL